MDSDADRLALIQGLGGISVATDNGRFDAVFENEFSVQQMGVGVESAAPYLQACSSDVARLNLVKDSQITIPKCIPVRAKDEVYRVARLEHDGTGMCNVVLKR